MGGAILSIGSVAFLFAETVKFQAEDQITKVLEGKVSTLHEVTDRTENLAYTLGVSVSTLHIRGAQTAGTYQELTRQLFESHPSYILGMGFGQKRTGILTDRDWFYPYYQIDSPVDTTQPQSPNAPLQTTAQAEKARYTNRAEAPYVYPDSNAYQSYFLPQESVWTVPYPNPDQAALDADNGTILTYYSQIFDDQKEWLGTVVVDVDGAYLTSILAEPVFRRGGKLVLLSDDGQVIANPASDESVLEQTYANIPGLSKIWPQVGGENSSGLIEGDRGYWSYIQIPEQSWVVLAYVPYRVVFLQIIAISLAAIALAGLLMAGATVLAIRYLNRRLRPVINECQRLSVEDDAITQRLSGKDELEQLSISFFNLLEQLQLTQTQVRLEAAHATEVEAQLSQIQTRSAANQRRRQTAAKKLADLLPQVNAAAINSYSLASPSTQQLQQELAQLNQVVASLAEDDWLIGVLPERRDGSAVADEPETAQVSRRLGHIFIQVLSALTQFSQLLSAFEGTHEHVLTIEQEMLTAKRDIEAQTAAVNRLEHWAQGHTALCYDLMRLADQSATATHSRRQAQKDELTATIATVQETTQTLSQQLRSLFDITESIDKKHRQYERINSAARVLIMNASTLSISASRQQDPSAFEKIVDQFHQKNTELQALSQQLENARTQQQQDALQIGQLIANLRLNVGVFEQTSQQYNKLLNDTASAESTAVATLSSRYGNGAASSQTQGQQLKQQLRTLRHSLQEIESLTVGTAQHIAVTLQETVDISQLQAEVPRTLPQK